MVTWPNRMVSAQCPRFRAQLTADHFPCRGPLRFSLAWHCGGCTLLGKLCQAVLAVGWVPMLSVLPVLAAEPAATTSTQGALEGRLPREQLLVYRQADGSLAEARTADEWNHTRRVTIAAGVAAVMGELPLRQPRCDLDVKVEATTDFPRHQRLKISYCSEPGSRVPAYLLRPKSTPDRPLPTKRPAVLALHPTHQQLGPMVVLERGDHTYDPYGTELADRGFVVLAPAYPTMGEYSWERSQTDWASGSLKAVWDNIRGLDLLSTLPDVDSRGFGTIGHSLGGHNSIYTAFHEPRLSVIVSCCGFDAYTDYYHGADAVWQPEAGWLSQRYLPRLGDYRGRLDEIPYDFHELIAALAPRPFLAIAPMHDGNFRADSVDRIAVAAREVYQLYAAGEQLQIRHPDCEHIFPEDSREEAYRLLESVLKRPPSP